jgi:hypothetical protein
VFLLLLHETFYEFPVYFTAHGFLDARKEKHRVLFEFYGRLEGVSCVPDLLDPVFDTGARYENMIVGHHLDVLIGFVLRVPHCGDRRFRRKLRQEGFKLPLMLDLLQRKIGKQRSDFIAFYVFPAFFVELSPIFLHLNGDFENLSRIEALTHPEIAFLWPV